MLKFKLLLYLFHILYMHIEELYLLDGRIKHSYVLVIRLK